MIHSFLHPNRCNNDNHWKSRLFKNYLVEEKKLLLRIPYMQRCFWLIFVYTLAATYFNVRHVCQLDKAPPPIMFPDFYITSKQLQTDSIEAKCKNHHSWYKDLVWRDAILNPKLCGIETDSMNTEMKEQHLLLFQETMYKYAHYRMPPCGEHCIYTYQSLYSPQYGQPVMFYVLWTSSEDPTERCWKPFTSQYENSPCELHHFDKWIKTMESYTSVPNMIPNYQCRNWNSSTTAGITASTVLNTNSQPTDSSSNIIVINKNTTDSCYDEMIVDKYVHNQFTSRRKCQNIKMESERSQFNKLQQWLLSTKSDKSSHNDQEHYAKLSFHQRSPFCNKQLLNITSPMDLVQLYGKHQMGMQDLANALLLFNYSSSVGPVIGESGTTVTPESQMITCNNNEEVNQCIYHYHAIPSFGVKKGQFGVHVPIKGWEYNIKYQCFIPVIDMESHPICGRRSEQYQTWARHMILEQHQLQVSKSVQSLTASDSKSSIQEVKRPKCDKVPLTHGRYYWDYSEGMNKAVYLHPNITKGQTTCGPRILIAGVMKCGTNSIGTLLSQHPRIKMNLCPNSELEGCALKNFQGDFNIYTQQIETIWENHGLSHEYVTDPINYIGHFAKKLPLILEDDISVTFDKSPSYITTEIFPNIAQRTHALLPNAKIIISICDPVQRLYSEYNHVWNENEFNGRFYEEQFYLNHKVRIPNNFTEFVEDLDPTATVCHEHKQFCNDLRRNKLDTGKYVDEIQDWRNYYGKENVLVLNMHATNEEKMREILSLTDDFLPSSEYPWEYITHHSNLTKSFKNTKYNGRYTGHHEHRKAFEWLYQYFNNSNKLLAKEVQDLYPYLWNEQATSSN